MKILVNVKKWHVFLVSAVLFISVGMFFVNAWGGENPEAFGHSLGEIEQGGVLSISGIQTGVAYTGLPNPPKTFSVNKVFSNSLFEVNPVTSDITIKESGNYIASSSVNLCTTGATTYVAAQIAVNDVVKTGTTGHAAECGSATTTLYYKLEAGDVISGRCSLNQVLDAYCYFNLARIS